MKISTLKQGINDGLMNIEFESNTDKIFLSCVMFSFIKEVAINDISYRNNVKTLVESYLDTVMNSFTIYKKQAVTYNIAAHKIKGYKKDTFMALSGNEIGEINTLYQNKTMMIPFSISSFSQYMYKVGKIKYYQYRRLSTIHFEVMVPIIQHYMDNYHLDEDSIEIYDAEGYPDNPGKEIYFIIKDVAPSRIVNDIKNNRIPIMSKLYSIEVKSPYVRIITN